MKIRIIISMIGVLALLNFYSCKSANETADAKSPSLENIKNSYIRTGSWQIAKEKLENYIVKNQIDSRGYYLYSVVLYEMKEYTQAVIEMNKAINLERRNNVLGMYYYNLGNYYYNMNIETALSMYEKAVVLNNSIDSTYYMIGLIYYKKQDIRKCIDYWNEYINMTKNEFKKNQIKKIITNLKSKK